MPTTITLLYRQAVCCGFLVRHCWKHRYLSCKCGANEISNSHHGSLCNKVFSKQMNCRAEARILSEKDNWTQKTVKWRGTWWSDGREAEAVPRNLRKGKKWISGWRKEKEQGDKRKGGRELKRSKRLEGRRRQQNNKVVYWVVKPLHIALRTNSKNKHSFQWDKSLDHKVQSSH